MGWLIPGKVFFYITTANVVDVDDANLPFQPAPSPRSVQVAARATDKVLYQHESLAPGGDVDWIPAVRNTTEIVHFQWQQNIRKINCAVTLTCATASPCGIYLGAYRHAVDPVGGDANWVCRYMCIIIHRRVKRQRRLKLKSS